MTKLEHTVWADDRTQGTGYTAAGLAIGLTVGALVRSTTAALTIALGAGSLRSVATEIGGQLRTEDLDAARLALPALVGRDPSGLDESGIAAAVIESLAENTVDATIAPMFWAVVAGAPGALGYRCVNTMDAMVGHHSDRFENFGWASARLDDAANWVPARLFAGLVIAAAPRRRQAICQALRTDAPAHPSPNAGVAEAAAAAALGIQLGGTLRYGDPGARQPGLSKLRVEHRPLLGTGPRPTAASIQQATDLMDRTQILAVALTLGVAALRHLRVLRPL